MSGSNGFNGISGSYGGNGTDGYAGSRGSNGYRGPDLEVYATSYYDTIIKAELLYVRVKNIYDDRIKNYFINVDGGTIDILSRGGNGGCGGDGGTGGNGGAGSDGIIYHETVYVNDSTTRTEIRHGPGENGGNGGNGGYGGDGGDGGRGGDITLFYTPYAQPYLHLIRRYSNGGNGSSGGFYGSGGSGGIGGNGSPSGHSGSSGLSGGSGHSGYDGRSGSIRCIPVPENNLMNNLHEGWNPF